MKKGDIYKHGFTVIYIIWCVGLRHPRSFKNFPISQSFANLAVNLVKTFIFTKYFYLLSAGRQKNENDTKISSKYIYNKIMLTDDAEKAKKLIHFPLPPLHI